MKPRHIILEGITGSKAYGLDTEHSDTDIKGVYLLPTREVLKLNFNVARTTVDHKDPDWAYHEVQKFMGLALGGNPTIIELLYLDDYLILDKFGELLVKNRKAFLNKSLYKSYPGYCYSQALKLNARQNEGKEGYDSSVKNRYAKHTRHLFRLLQQGEQLITTGELDVRVKNRDEIFAYGELPPSEVVELFLEKIKVFETLKGVIPDKPDYDKINEILLEIRYANL